MQTEFSQQKIGNYQIDAFNSTDFVVSVNAEGVILGNNQAFLNTQAEVLKFAKDDPLLKQLEAIGEGKWGVHYVNNIEDKSTIPNNLRGD